MSEYTVVYIAYLEKPFAVTYVDSGEIMDTFAKEADAKEYIQILKTNDALAAGINGAGEWSSDNMLI